LLLHWTRDSRTSSVNPELREWASVTNLIRNRGLLQRKTVETTTAKPTKRKFALLAVSSDSDSEHEEDSVENSVYRYRAEPTNIELGDLHAFSVAKVSLEFRPAFSLVILRPGLDMCPRPLPSGNRW